MIRTAPLLLGTALVLATVALPATAQVAGAQVPAAQTVATYGQDHAEAVLGRELSRQITAGRLRIEFDNRAVELRAPAGAGSLTAENVYYNPVSGRFAAELVVPGTKPAVRLPVAGRAYGVVEVPVLNRRIGTGDTISAQDIAWVEMRADQAGSDVAASESDLVGMTPKRGVPVNQPVRLRDIQSPRLIDKGALVTITLSTPSMSLSAQGKALQDGGRGDVIRVVNTQSNRIVEATVAGPNLVAVAKPGVPTY